jgi:hypothetical protein
MPKLVNALLLLAFSSDLESMGVIKVKVKVKNEIINLMQFVKILMLSINNLSPWFKLTWLINWKYNYVKVKRK